MAGVVQTVLTTRPPTAPLSERLGDHARVVRLGLPVRHFKQLNGPQAALLAPLLAARADVVHVHLGEDLAMLPAGAAAARLHRLPLVLTVHTSMRHTLAVTDLRSAVLKRLGGKIEGWGNARRTPSSPSRRAWRAYYSRRASKKTACTSSHRA